MNAIIFFKYYMPLFIYQSISQPYLLDILALFSVVFQIQKNLICRSFYHHYYANNYKVILRNTIGVCLSYKFTARIMLTEC